MTGAGARGLQPPVRATRHRCRGRTTSGTNFKNGAELAVKEINAGGGVLGRMLETSVADTQSNPGVAKGLATKAVDDGVFAVFGPVFSGSSARLCEFAGDAANGAVSHVGLTVDAPIALVRAFRARFEKEYKYVPDHNGIKGYTGMYILKAAIEKVGKPDRKLVAQALHGLAVSAAQQPGVRNGKQEVKEILPALGAKQPP